MSRASTVWKTRTDLKMIETGQSHFIKQIQKESAKVRKTVRTKAWTAKVGTRPKSSRTGNGS